MSCERIVIVGNGMATDRLLDDLLAGPDEPDASITVIGDEPYGNYNRILLARVVRGADPDLITTKPPSWYVERGVTFLGATAAVSIDTGERLVALDDGTAIAYDRAVLATGSVATVPDIEFVHDPFGAMRSGVHVFRTMDDAVRLRAHALELQPQREPCRAVVIGGGLLGLEAAETLVRMGLPVTVLHPFEELLNSQLDGVGGRMLRDAVRRLGIDVVVGAARAIAGFERVTGVVLDDGRLIPGQMVVSAIGVRPRIELAARSGIAVDRGVLVDEQLATSARRVYAIGECTQFRGRTIGFVQPCWEQASVLAGVLGRPDRPPPTYAAGRSVARLKVAGLDVASMGVTEPTDPDDDVVQVVEERTGRYRKLIVRDGRLAGAVLVGAPDTAARVIQQYLGDQPAPEEPLDLLCSSAALVGAPAGASVVCNCNDVSRDTVIEAIRTGCDTVDDLQRATRANTGCGSCTNDLLRLLDAHRPAVATP